MIHSAGRQKGREDRDLKCFQIQGQRTTSGDAVAETLLASDQQQPLVRMPGVRVFGQPPGDECLVEGIFGGGARLGGGVDDGRDEGRGPAPVGRGVLRATTIQLRSSGPIRPRIKQRPGDTG